MKTRTTALLLAFFLLTLAPAPAQALTGDVNADGSVNVIDIQCTVLTALNEVAPGCLAGFELADINCDLSIDIIDVQLVVLLIVNSPLPGIPESKDVNGNNVHDDCECIPDCADKDCGDDGCEGSCGTCTGPQELCIDGLCICQPACQGKVCGDNGCQGTCGICPGPQDLCVDGACVCQPACEGLECGDDGCEGSCGDCPGQQDLCVDGLCECQPACDGRDCGDDGCEGSCGTCTGLQELCVDGLCECQPACDGKECGPDGCDGDCGTCLPGSLCEDGACECQPSCGGKECGDDGCGGSCGACAPGSSCETGVCTCLPQQEATAIECGSTVVGNNGAEGSTQAFDSYPECVSWNESGPENLYLFTPNCTSQSVVVGLSGMSADLDLFVLDSNPADCGNFACADYSGSELVMSASKDVGQYLVVDGYAGAISSYLLTVDCNCEQQAVCGDDSCDAGEDSCNCLQDCPIPAEWTCDAALFGDGSCDCDCLAVDHCDCEPEECAAECGDGFCDVDENCADCPDDCTCVCEIDAQMSCGATLEDSTWGNSNKMSDYSCAWWDASGPEYTIQVKPYCDGTLTATFIKQTGGELDIFALPGCLSNDGCLGAGESSVSVTATKDINTYLVIDGTDGDVGDFKVQVDCECDQDDKCTAYDSITCDSTFSGSTAGEGTTDLLDEYLACSEWAEDGPEQVLSFHADCAGMAKVSFVESNADLDLFILDADQGCAAAGCIAFGGNKVVWETEENHDYFVVVDGYLGDSGDYTIETTCACGVDYICNDGVCHEEEDECSCIQDCWDPVGWTCPLGKWGDGVCDCDCGIDDSCDCTPEECLPSCDLAGTIECGQSVTASTVGGGDDLDSYNCTEYSENGADLVYEVLPGDCTGIATATLDPGQVDLDVMFLTACGADYCAEYGDATAKAYITSGVKSYIAVDGFNQAEGSFQLDLACECGVQPSCGDGACGDGETVCTCPDDCWDSTDWACPDSWWGDGVCDCSCARFDSCDCPPGVCGPQCGDGVCSGAENNCNCVLDCSIPAGWTCPKTQWDDASCDQGCGVADSCDC